MSFEDFLPKKRKRDPDLVLTLTVHLKDIEMKRWLKKRAEIHGASVSNVIIAILKAEMERNGGG